MRLPPHNPSIMSDIKSLPIILADLTNRPRFIHDEKTGKHDLVGQILYQLGYPVQPKSKVLTDMIRNCPPLTILIRGEIQPSPLGIELMVITQSLPPQEQVRAANVALAKYNAQFRVHKA